MQFSHVSVFSDSRNVQKSVTQIMYLGPLSTFHQLRSSRIVSSNRCKHKTFLK